MLCEMNPLASLLVSLRGSAIATGKRKNRATTASESAEGKCVANPFGVNRYSFNLICCPGRMWNVDTFKICLEERPFLKLDVALSVKR